MMSMFSGAMATQEEREDLPAGYFNLIFLAKKLAASISSVKEILMMKMLTYSGVQNLSAETVNSSNSLRIDTYKSAIRHCFPYIKLDEDEKKKSLGTVEDLVERYKQIFGDPKDRQKKVK